MIAVAKRRFHLLQQWGGRIYHRGIRIDYHRSGTPVRLQRSKRILPTREIPIPKWNVKTILDFRMIFLGLVGQKMAGHKYRYAVVEAERSGRPSAKEVQ